MVHEVSQFRVSRALEARSPQSVNDVWRLLESIGVDPYAVVGKDNFDAKHGGRLLREGYAEFNPDVLLQSAGVSDHVKALVRDLF